MRTGEAIPGRLQGIGRWTGWILLAATVVAAFGGLGWRTQSSRFTGSELAMDTLITVTVYGRGAEAHGQEALAEFRRVDRLLSAYRPESDIGRVNTAAGRVPVKVSRETLNLVSLSLEYGALSGGRFDPTVGPLVRLWGIGKVRATPPAAAQVAVAQRLVDYRRVVVDSVGSRLYLPLKGMALDLGGVAKGYAAQRAAELLRRRGVRSGLIDAGGNIVALGTRPDGRPWRVAVRHPRKERTLLGVLSVVDRSVVTSGDYERYFESGGRRYHHLLDPSTGYPAQGLESATVVGSSSTVADILSTAVFVLGRDRGPAFARQHGFRTVTVDSGGRVEVDRGLVTAWTPVSKEAGA